MKLNFARSYFFPFICLKSVFIPNIKNPSCRLSTASEGGASLIAGSALAIRHGADGLGQHAVPVEAREPRVLLCTLCDGGAHSWLGKRGNTDWLPKQNKGAPPQNRGNRAVVDGKIAQKMTQFLIGDNRRAMMNDRSKYAPLPPPPWPKHPRF